MAPRRFPALLSPAQGGSRKRRGPCSSTGRFASFALFPYGMCSDSPNASAIFFENGQPSSSAPASSSACTGAIDCPCLRLGCRRWDQTGRSILPDESDTPDGKLKSDLRHTLIASPLQMKDLDSFSWLRSPGGWGGKTQGWTAASAGSSCPNER